VTSDPSRDLAALAQRYWDATQAFSPIHATYLGDRRFDADLDDRSDVAIQAHGTRLAAIAADVQAVDETGLGREDRITRSALLAQIRGDRAYLAAGLVAWNVDPIDGPHISAMNLEAIQPVVTPEQAQAMVARWNALGPWFDARGDRLRGSLGEGCVGVHATVEKVVDQLTSTLARPDEAFPLLAPLAVPHPDWTAVQRAAFDEGLRSAVRDVVRPALVRYLAVVRDEILPVAR
jgi:uncharacterized protein (DUF885 family)